MDRSNRGQQAMRRRRSRAKAPSAIGISVMKDGSGASVTSVVSMLKVENTSLAPLKGGLVVGERPPSPGPCRASEICAVPPDNRLRDVFGMETDKISYSLWLAPVPAFRASDTVLSNPVKSSPPASA